MKENYEPEEELDSDKIDYSTALRRELGRSQASGEILRQNSNVNNQVLTGFSNDKFITQENNKNNDIVFDVLPSFQLYNSLQHPPNHEVNNIPPDYTPSCCSSFPSIPSISRDFSEQSTESVSLSDSNEIFQPFEFNADEDLFNKNLIDNLDKLNVKLNHGLEIQIHVTKDVPVPHKPSEAESPLKEYTSGDVVHGYVDVINRTKVPITFQAFYVTLQGVVSIIDVNNKKQVIKQLINMVDFSASWSFACISPSGNIHYEPLSKDFFDGAQLGLSNERILQPEERARKFFTFKFPYNSLDTSCRHQQELHTLLPPSLGINVLKDKGKYSTLEVNPALNFGRNSRLGSPILTKDLSNRKLSVNYNINAIMCDTKIINKAKKLCIIQQNDFALRFIPFGFGVSLFSSRNSIIQLKNIIKSNFNNAERSLKLLKDGEVFDNEIKLQQLSNDIIGLNSSNFPLRNRIGNFLKVQTGLSFNSEKKFLFNKSSSNNGFLSISTEIPKDGLPYISPSLIRKTNEVSKLTSLGFENLEGMKNLLSTNEKKKLNDLKITFKFNPSDFSKEVSLPKLTTIEVTLLVVNIFSTNSIPIKLSADICDPILFKNFKNEFIEYNDELIRLTDEFNKLGKNIREYIHYDIISDIKSMKNLTNESFDIDVFKSNIKSQTDWEKIDNSYSKELEINLEFLNNIKETLIPNFQTCLVSRSYFISVKFYFGKNSTILRVPIRLRQFDGLS